MAAAISRGSSMALASKVDPGAGLSIDLQDHAGDFLADHRYRVAIDGYPYWTRDDLSTIAVNQGLAAALLESWRRYGIELFAFLHGPFSFALLDCQAGEAMLAIDRFGIHSMCYSSGSKWPFVFGSTTDSVRAHPQISNTVDPQAIYNYFNYSVVPAAGTIYSEQQKLLPAQYLHYRPGRLEVSFYWQMPYAEQHQIPRAARMTVELRELLNAAVRRAIGRTAPNSVGAFLSGGLDSSTVAGLLGVAIAAPPKTFTIGFDVAGYDETHYARIAANHFSAIPHEYFMTPQDAADAIFKVCAFYDEPFGNSSAIPTYYCARLAKDRNLDLVLAGDGGDELFAGNARYAGQAALDRYFRIPRPARELVLEPTIRYLDRFFGRGPLRRACRYIKLTNMPLPDRMLAYELMSDEEVRAMFSNDLLNAVNRDQPLEIAREVYHRTRSTSALQRLLHLDLQLALADNDLRKVAGMCRMVGISVRFPMLDEDLAVCAAHVPPDSLMSGTRLRKFYKSAMRGFLPTEILRKRKHGFGMPYDVWLRNDRLVRQVAGDSLADFKRRSYCLSAYLEDLFQRTLAGDTCSTSRLWDIMMLEQWLRAHGVSL